MIEILIRNELLNATPITAIVAQRIYLFTLPQDVIYPALAYQLISRVGRTVFHNGSSRWVESRFQFSSLSNDIKQSRVLSKAIADLFVGFKKEDANGTVAVVTFENELEQIDPEVGMCQTSLDLIFTHTH